MSSATEPTPPADSESSDAIAQAASTEGTAKAPVTGGTALARLRVRVAAWFDKGRLLALAKVYWADALFWVLSALLVAWTAWDAIAIRVATYSGGADYWEHAAALRELIVRPFSPRNPQVLSDAPSPRFGPHYLIVALVTRLFDGNSLDAMALAQVLNTALFALGIYLFFGTYFRDRRAPLYALVVMFGSWWSAWNFSNVYQLKWFFRVASYPSTATLALTMIGFWLTVRTLRAARLERWTIAALAVCWSYIFITHPLTAMLSLSGCGLLALTEPGVALVRRAWVVGSVVAGLVLSALWPYFPAFEVLAGGKGEESGWIARSVSDVAKGAEPYKLHYFYRTSRLLETLGFALIGIPLSVVTLFTRYRFIGLGALSMGAPFVINAFVPLPLGHRFILLTVFYLQLAMVWLLVLVSPKPGVAPASLRNRVLGWGGSAFVVVSLAVMGFLTIDSAVAEFVDARARAAESESVFVRYARRVGDIAGSDAIVLGDGVLTWPLPAFGPRVVTLKHENPLVEARVAREEAVTTFFERRTKDSERMRILEHFKVTHVLVRDKQERAVADFLAEHGDRHRVPGGHRLYALDVPWRPY